MLKYLYDIPNAITATGLVLTTLSLNLILEGRINVAIVLLMWAVMLDHIDGWVARHQPTRSSDNSRFGGDLDSLTDFVSAGVAPWLIVAQLNTTGPFPLATSLMLLPAAALRVAYFNNFGLKEDGRFFGLPLTYNVPVCGLILMLDRYGWPISVDEVLPWILMTLAIMHVVPFGPPPVRGIGFPIIFSYSVLLTIAMLR